MDWGLGNYEQIAAQLLPAAEVVVDRAAPVRGERVVDIGCGTGNASLLAAERGARVTGVDPAGRLLDVAVLRAAGRLLEIGFTQGEAGALPLDDASVDLLVSVFGVIFAPDAQVAAAEMARVLAPGGRIVLSAWVPDGALWEVQRIRSEALVAAGGAVRGASSFAWHDEHALAGLLGPHGFSVELEKAQLSFSAASPLAFLEAELEDHPAWVDTAKALTPAAMQNLRARALEIFQDANEESGSFRVTSRYVVLTARRG
jgi:SAM-dependent methyltransferase